MRIALDTNVVVSGLLWRGTPYRLIEAVCAQRVASFVTSEASMAEFADVLTRPSAQRRLALLSITAAAVLDDYAAMVDIVESSEPEPLVAADPDDDHVIAAAVAGAADLIVSGDRHLLALGGHLTVRIVTPSEALALLA